MTQLHFEITGAQAKKHAASPTIAFGLNIVADGDVEAMVLRVQIRIEPQWRSYEAREKTLLGDLFGTPDRWDTTLRTLSWADVPVVVTAFACETQAEICVPCTYDFDLAATRFFTALGSGEVPLRFLFSGSIFREEKTGFSSERVPWSCEAAYRMPLDVWNDAMRACYGDDVLVRVSRETFEYLQSVRALSNATSFDSVILSLSKDPRAPSRAAST
jgi:hypothetical protein